TSLTKDRGHQQSRVWRSPTRFDAMYRTTAGVLILMAAAVAPAADQPAPGDQTLPATDINRESNNPAKAAIKAREAQNKDKAKQEAVAEETAAPPAGPVADPAQLV